MPNKNATCICLKKSATSPTCVWVCVWKSWIYGKQIGTTTIIQGYFWGYLKIPKNLWTNTHASNAFSHSARQSCNAHSAASGGKSWLEDIPQTWLDGPRDFPPLLCSMAITWGSSITLGCIMRDSKETQQPSKIIGDLRWVFHQTPFRNCNIYIKNMVSEIILNRDPKISKLYHHSHCFNGHKIGEKHHSPRTPCLDVSASGPARM